MIEFASNFYIGLATEIKLPCNRNICITNKLFAFIQAGNAVDYIDALAWHCFIKQYVDAGFMYSNVNVDSFSSVIFYYYSKRDILENIKRMLISWVRKN